MVGDVRHIRAGVGADEGREEDRLDHAVLLAGPVAQEVQDLVWHVARVVPQRTGAGMRPDDGGLGHFNRLPHGRDRRVREINHDPDAVEFLDQLDPQICQRVAFVGLRDRCPGSRGRCERAVAGVRERQVADAQLCENAQNAQRVAQQMRAFHADQGCDLAGAERVPYLSGRPGVLQVVWMPRDHVLDHVEHLQRVAHVAGGIVEVRPGVFSHHIVARRPDRPERAAESSFSHAWDVHVPWEGPVQLCDPVQWSSVCWESVNTRQSLITPQAEVSEFERTQTSDDLWQIDMRV